MPRKTRIEYSGARYHVINRGNYREGIFDTPGARASFLECLKLTCMAQGWVLHAWVLMGNHYHLCLETPQPNLIEGMRWLQSTFANRFNRFRNANGHVFQGRYKAILLDPGALGDVCHYIHLNPVRAGIVPRDQLDHFDDSSFAQLWRPRRRWSMFDPQTSLAAAGGLRDTPTGRRLYRDYLGWIATTDSEKKRRGFAQMCRGWAKGTAQFKQEVAQSLSVTTLGRVVEAEASELRETGWERHLKVALKLIRKTNKALAEDRKGAPWKVAVARHLRERHLVPNTWIAQRLKMGCSSSVQAWVSRHRHNHKQTDEIWDCLKS